MRKDTWIIIGVMVALVGLQATFMVTGLASIESRLTAMDNQFSGRLTAMDNQFSGRLTATENHLSGRLTATENHLSGRLTAMDNNFSDRLTAIDGRLHEMNTRLSRIEGHLGLPAADVEPIQFETIGFTRGVIPVQEFEYLYRSAPHLPGSCTSMWAGRVYGNSPFQRKWLRGPTMRPNDWLSISQA